MEYNANCKKCTRLNHFLLKTKKKYPAYFCKPVPSFGEKEPGFMDKIKNIDQTYDSEHKSYVLDATSPLEDGAKGMKNALELLKKSAEKKTKISKVKYKGINNHNN